MHILPDALRRRSSRAAVTALALGSLVWGGCVHASIQRGNGASSSGAGTEALKTADRAFAADVAREGLPAWLRWFAPNGAQLAPGKIVRTDAERREHMAGLFGDPTLRLAWEPDTASIAAGGDLGYTIGRYQLRKLKPDGSFTVLSTGRYLTIWRKQPDGSWKAELDTGNPDPAPNAP